MPDRATRRGTALLAAALLLPTAAPAQRPDTLPTPRVPDAVLEAIPRGLFVDLDVVGSAALGWEEAGASGGADRPGLGAGLALGFGGTRLAARVGGELVVPGIVTRHEVRVSQFLLVDVRLLGRRAGSWRPAVTGGYVHQMLTSADRGDEGDSHGARLGLTLERPFAGRATLRAELGGDLFHAETGEWYAVPRVALGYRWRPPDPR